MSAAASGFGRVIAPSAHRGTAMNRRRSMRQRVRCCHLADEMRRQISSARFVGATISISSTQLTEAFH
jgi:hypothetical protein